MDLLNTFFLFNLTATIALLVGFFFTRENIAATVENTKAKITDFNIAGAAGAATSMMLLASIAVLFR